MKRRTKKQKLQAKHPVAHADVRGIGTQSLFAKKTPLVHVPAQAATATLFAYDTALIYRDLRKTLMIVLFLFSILFGVYFFLSPSLHG